MCFIKGLMLVKKASRKHLNSYLEVDFQRFFETETLTPGRVKYFIYLKNDGFFQDKQKQNRVKDYIEIENLMEYLNEVQRGTKAEKDN